MRYLLLCCGALALLILAGPPVPGQPSRRHHPRVGVPVPQPPVPKPPVPKPPVPIPVPPVSQPPVPAPPPAPIPLPPPLPQPPVPVPVPLPATVGFGLPGEDPAIAVVREQLYNGVNQVRAAAGVPPLRFDTKLTQAAQAFSLFMGQAKFFAHNGPDGSTPLARMQVTGFPGNGFWGENIGAGYSDAQAMLQVWMASPGHRANLLNLNFSDVGLGFARVPGSPYTDYWTQDFAHR